MRNKGFFWFLTILLTAVCLYQLSYTWVATSQEAKASKQADQLVAELKESAKSTDNIGQLPNGTEVNFSNADSEDIAKAAFLNDILKGKAEKEIYFGNTFQQVKNKSLAFGLDLVGGMSVTMEISVPELVQSYATRPNSLEFRKPFERAKREYVNGGDFVDLFAKAHKDLNGSKKLVQLFDITAIDVINKNSTDNEVKDFLKEMIASSMDGVEEIMNRRINQFGVAQPNIQKDPNNNRLYIELPGVQDEVTVAEKLSSTANLQFYEVLTPQELGPSFAEAVTKSQKAYNASFIDEMEEEESLDTAIVAADSDSSAALADGTDVIGDSGATNNEDVDISELLEEEQTADGKAVVGLDKLVMSLGQGTLLVKPEDKLTVSNLLKREDVKGAFQSNVIFMFSDKTFEYDDAKKLSAYELFFVKVPENGKAMVGGSDISNATVGFDQGKNQTTVDLDMTTEGADRWAEMTGNNVGERIAITLDSVVYSAPNVEGAITGRTQITGGFSFEEAKDLAGLLNGGALPAPCIIKDQTRVGPTIGAENTQAGLLSFGIALLLVFIYMAIYYGKAGLVADIALIANIIFIFGSLASFGAVLTLAGIAGIVLTIGMAVDANVLIYERIREELAMGVEKSIAIENGFRKALSSIIDANVTTLLTAIVLKIFGSGPIESFATTLIIGIFTSLFAALVVTRLILTMWAKKDDKLTFGTSKTINAFKNLNINFVGRRKTYYLISGVIILAGVISLAVRGLNLSVEFSGGRTYGVQFDKNVSGDLEYLKENVANTLSYANGTKSSVEAKTKSSSYFVEITTNYMRTNDTVNTLVKNKLAEALEKTKDRLGNYEIMESRNVSPSISNDLIKGSSIAILLSLLIIFAYILIRFGKWQYSLGALIAMAHDVILVLAAFSLFYGILPFTMDVDQAFIAAILTVIGYSINDTVIVFDRIREDLKFGKSSDQATEINGALNSTLSRTINTSMTTFVVLLAIFIFGGASIKGFIFALMVGVVVGTYSSLCIATPILIDFTKKIKA